MSFVHVTEVNRSMRKFLLTVAASLLLATGFAPKAEASVGIGFLYSSTPVALFFRLNDRTAFHVGVGVDIFDTEEDSGDLKSIFSVAGTVLYDLWTGDCWGFGLAPGVIFSTASFEDDDGEERDSATEIAVLLWLMGHWDPCDWLSFWFGHGLTVTIDDDGVNDSTTNFGTDGANLGEVGFTVWLPE
jgi:hypothetical protein